MAERGAVFRLKRKLGFGQGDLGEPVVVMQASELNAALPTTIVVPLDLALDLYDGIPTVPVSPEEVGATERYVALPTQLRTISLERLAPGAVGHLRPKTIVALDEMVRVVLDL
ncbi:MAG: hypothetical protein DRJ42_10265 [Deltaproteobacteria bacterium]|nr:MAG: hypothetical protein DRJ42_10265 [Deltaproteobacteria bacterium]